MENKNCVLEKISAFAGQQGGETQNKDRSTLNMPCPKHKSSPEDFQTLEDRPDTSGQPQLLSLLGFSHSHSAQVPTSLPQPLEMLCCHKVKVRTLELCLLQPPPTARGLLQGKAVGELCHSEVPEAGHGRKQVLLRAGHCPGLVQF